MLWQKIPKLTSVHSNETRPRIRREDRAFDFRLCASCGCAAGRRQRGICLDRYRGVLRVLVPIVAFFVLWRWAAYTQISRFPQPTRLTGVEDISLHEAGPFQKPPQVYSRKSRRINGCALRRWHSKNS